jgi:apolipoprotein N-acyltransferase
VLCLFRLPWNGHKVSGRLACVAVVISLVGVGTGFGYGNWRLKDIQSKMVKSPKTRVSIVQGNIPQDQKWDAAFRQNTTEKYIRMSRKSIPGNPDLIVWPETATPFYFGYEKELTAMVRRGITESGKDYLIGSPSFEPGPGTLYYRNSAYLLGSNDRTLGRYDKAHLVPFGEYIPFKKWLPFLGKMVEQVGDFHPGAKGVTLDWKGVQIGVQICYEIIFPGLSATMSNNGAQLLINLTNDAWYGRTSAPFQHFSMTVFRAVENRKSLVRAANTGISGFVDPTGEIRKAGGLFKDIILTDDVPLMKEQTRYAAWGDALPLACLVISAIFVCAAAVRKGQ